MARLAWFAPLPPVRSGIAAYNAELLPYLTETHDIDVFVDRSEKQSGPQCPIPGAAVFDAHDFVWKQANHPYDLVVYQLGNATYHDYMWPYLVRYSGLVVLHDGQLHHARGRWLRQHRRNDDYRTEFAYNHPDVSPDVAELGVAGLLESLNYFWPMLRIAIQSARVVAAHNPRLVGDLCEQFPETRIEAISMGVKDDFCDERRRSGYQESRNTSPTILNEQLLRARYGIANDAVVFAAFGRVTPEKRISQALSALAAGSETTQKTHLLLVGPTADYYDASTEAKALGIANRVTLTQWVEDSELPNYINAADVCLCLRWPSSRETSASWLRCLAAGKPTIITDLIHTVDVTALDPRSWTINYATQEICSHEENSTLQTPEPTCVSIDILDEDHSLKLAMERLTVDGKLRERLGNQARKFWQKTHTMERMVTDYRRVINLALIHDAKKTRNVDTALPAHLRPDGTEYARQLLLKMGLSVDFLNGSEDP